MMLAYGIAVLISLISVQYVNGYGFGCKDIDQSCTFNSDCCSGSCTFSKCRGSAQQCARVGQSCSFNSNCCSNDCSFSHCRGSQSDCAFADQDCTWDRECCSKDCHFRKCRGGARLNQYSGIAFTRLG